MNLGWFCMSWRQPLRTAIPAAANNNHAMRICAGRLIRHLRYLFRLEAFQQLAGIRQTEPWVLRFNAQEEPVPAGAHKVRRIENRVIWLRQSIQRQHSEYGRKTR